MRFNGLDLNLLATFSVLLEEGSVSRAAQRLNVTQPAVSAALARLRAFFGDDLLISEGKRMLATPLAEALRPQLEEILESVTSLLDSSRAFDPAVSRRTFRVMGSDYITMVLMMPIIKHLARVAPGIQIKMELPNDNAQSRLSEGKIDLVIIPEEFASPRHPADLIFEERHVVVGCAENRIFQTHISKDDFLHADHVAVLLGAEAPQAFADRQLHMLDIHRNEVVTVPNFSAVPWMVMGTARIGLMHERLAVTMASYLPIAISPMPFEFPPMREILQHHRVRSKDPALSWLRRLILDHASSS